MSDELQFDKAETGQTGAPACHGCNTPLAGQYFQAGEMMVCGPCSEGIRAHLAGTGSSGGRFMRALLLGVGAAAIGAIVYGLWMHFTKSEFALVTIAIGWFVGKAVRKGSGGLGGMAFGATAVMLTYAAISLSFLISLIAMFASNAPGGGAVDPAAPVEPVSLVSSLFAMFSLSLQLPVMVAMESPLSGLITGFGLWQAWVMNRLVQVEITGPHTLGGAPTQAPAGA